MKYLWPTVSQVMLPRHTFLLLATLVWLCCPIYVRAQAVQISGRVTDATTGEAIPFANVLIAHTSQGTTTDLEGYYQLSIAASVDSLYVSFVGYVSQTRAIPTDLKQQLDFVLTPDVVSLDEVVVYAGENPAFALLKKVREQRKVNDKRTLLAYDYESYIRTEVDLSNVSGKIKSRMIRKALKAIESQRTTTDTSGHRDIPIVMTETLSQVYYQNNPEVKREDLIKTKISGIGLSSNSWLSQLTGSSLQQFNFYENWVKIIGKDFMSPFAPSGRVFYEYFLSDSLFLIEGDLCYQLEFTPKNERDLVFVGTCWITQETAAIKQIHVRTSAKANINYIRGVAIEQQLVQTAGGAWIPKETATTIRSVAFGDYPGLRVKSHVSNHNITINETHPASFYATNITIDENAYRPDTALWQQHRQSTMTKTDLQAYAMIDTLNQVPSIRRLTKLIDTFASSYYDIGLIELGPFPYTYAHNVVEGHRLRLGFKTSTRFSSRWLLRNYLAYGTRDKKFKYGIEADYIVNRSPWTLLSIEHSQDLSQLGWFPESEKEVKFFEAAALFGNLTTGYRYRRSSISLFRQLPMGFAPEAAIRRQWMQPLFDFSYPVTTENGMRDTSMFTTTEVQLALRFAHDEQFVQRDNRRVSLGARRWPVFRAEYTLGLNNVLGGNFSYQKFKLNVSQKVKLGLLGTSQYDLESGYIFSKLPYPLLEVHLGNNSPFYYKQGFNTMSRAEFVSDHYAILRYTHFFEGFFLNRIPMLRKLEWRLLTSANILYGGVRDENKAYQTVDGQPQSAFGFIDPQKPFVEVGYGVENIFHLIRLEAYHRLNYLDHPGASKFAIKVGFQIKF